MRKAEMQNISLISADVGQLNEALRQALQYVPDDPPPPMPKDGHYPGRDKDNDEYGMVWICEGEAEWECGNEPISDITRVILGDMIVFPDKEQEAAK